MARSIRRTHLAAAALLLLGASPGAASSALGTVYLAANAAISAPSGAADLCQRYDWACQRSGRAAVPAPLAVPLARKINRKINQQVRTVSDSVQYGEKEVWALPTARGGDCEDFALLKKRDLIRAGIPAEQLLIATVFGSRTGSHAVLILRLEDGDHVLDSMTDQIKPWSQTGYTFLRVQNPDAPHLWLSVYAAG